jgi:hypothetical protein
MCAADGRVFIGAGGKLLVFDAATRKVVQTIALPEGLLDVSLGVHRSGLLYGLSGRSVLAVDPRRGELALRAPSPVPVNCGFALTDDALYFGSGAQLWRYRIQAAGD